MVVEKRGALLLEDSCMLAQEGRGKVGNGKDFKTDLVAPLNDVQDPAICGDGLPRLLEVEKSAPPLIVQN